MRAREKEETNEEGPKMREVRVGGSLAFSEHVQTQTYTKRLQHLICDIQPVSPRRKGGRGGGVPWLPPSANFDRWQNYAIRL